MAKGTLEVRLPDGLKAPCLKLAEAIRAAGGRALLVGGSVRDALLGEAAEDLDIEVFGLEPTELEKIIQAHYPYDAVGQSFGVLKLKGLAIDISIPRRESKQGLGHQGFLIAADPHLSFKAAAARRDFTINAISWDPLTRELIDPFDGQKDLCAKTLRHVGPQFREDPLRVLRAMQFLARFELTIAEETLEECRAITPEGLSKERLMGEWKKWVLQGKKPSLGLHFLKACGWLQYYPELAALDGCPQDTEWHPEGDVFAHTAHCMDAYARERIGDSWEDLVVGFAVLCHDLGKPATTAPDENGRLRCFRHEIVGEGPTRSFLGKLTDEKALVEAVVPLVHAHMRPRELYLTQASDAAIRRLAAKVERIDRLVRVAHADMSGRPPLTIGDFPEGKWLLHRAQELAVVAQKPTPIILGRHLIALGLKPSPEFSKILKAGYEAQLDGTFHDEAGGIAFCKTLL
ncbi:MAG: polynucleotide adenylyltransferase [Verrucomicrobia bacterium 21-51-4]|nr:MAG: polynucleotide adenylyltransferase [Verrucomicrobia bacterium 21-51-4]HQU08598.1 polynucleotide adenylyltransferase [Opitutales bacterium]